MAVRAKSGRLPRLLAMGCAALLVASATIAPAAVRAQDAVPIAPDAPLRPNAYSIDWGRFDRLAAVARETAPVDRLADVARALKSNVPAEAGTLSPVDWYCLGVAWCASHHPGSKGKPYYRDATALEGEELYALVRKGYQVTPEQSTRIAARLLSMLGVPSETMTGLVRGAGIDRGSWVLCQVGAAYLRADIAACGPSQNGEWRPTSANFQASSDLTGVLAFLKAHLPDGDLTARLQGLKKPLSVADWEAWSKSEARLQSAAETAATDPLYIPKTGLFTPNSVGEYTGRDDIVVPPTPEALSAIERLRRKPYKPTRGEYLAATARKYVGLPYIWGGENPNSGFDCSGLMQYVCRVWGIALPRTAAEQYHIGRPVSFMDLEPGDLVFLANTYKPGVSHVGMYIGEGLWVQAQGSATGIVVGDVPYFDAGSGPGARRLNLAHLPHVAGEPAPYKAPNRAAVVVSRHSSAPRSEPKQAGTGGIVAVRVCGDTGAIANSGCDTYKLMRIPKSQLKNMRHCHKHKPLGGERW